MSEQQNIEIVRRGYEAFGRGDLDILLSLFDENIEWVTPGPPDLPTAGRRCGRQAVAEFFKTVNDVFEIQEFHPRDFIVQGDRVVVLGDDVSRVRSTGKSINFEWVHVFGLKDGKIVGFHEYGDTSAAVAEIRAAQART